MPILGRGEDRGDGHCGGNAPASARNPWVRPFLLGLMAGGLAMTASARALADPVYSLPAGPAPAGISVALGADGVEADAPVYGPPRDLSEGRKRDADRYRSFGSRVGAVQWEFAAMLAILTAVNLPKDLKHGSDFHFHDEGFFGRDTDNVGVDKLDHAFNTYLYSDILYARMKRKTGGGFQSALTAGILGVALQAYGEIYDGFEDSSGWSMQDTAFNVIGAGFSVLRNSVPGLDETLDFRVQITPNSHVYSHEGKEHFRQQHFLLALKLAGFDAFEDTPLRLVELQLGYYASGFTPRERARGETPERHPFVGIGLNVGELFFHAPRSRLGRAVRSVLEYVQVPYTAARTN